MCRASGPRRAVLVLVDLTEDEISRFDSLRFIILSFIPVSKQQQENMALFVRRTFLRTMLRKTPSWITINLLFLFVSETDDILVLYLVVVVVLY